MVETNKKIYRSIWIHKKNPRIIQIIDQRHLPHELVFEDLESLDDAVGAIKEMHVRGAPLIGITAAYGIYLALIHAPSESSPESVLEKAIKDLSETRPTAVNLQWALQKQSEALKAGRDLQEKAKIAFETANRMAEENVKTCEKIGEHGLKIIEEIKEKKKGEPVNILTHCNAGWLACVEWGTKTAPIYKAFEKGIPLHVWVDETRPRNQGAKLTAWELAERGVPHTVIVDNAGGHLMQHGKVDLVLGGADRVTRTADAANKIGTYLKALAAKDNSIPFYACVPSSSIDWNLRDGIHEIPIEERSGDEVKTMEGMSEGRKQQVSIMPDKSPVSNFGFDVTPSRLLSGLITERGICEASEAGLLQLFPEKK